MEAQESLDASTEPHQAFHRAWDSKCLASCMKLCSSQTQHYELPPPKPTTPNLLSLRSTKGPLADPARRHLSISGLLSGKKPREGRMWVRGGKRGGEDSVGQMLARNGGHLIQ